MNNLLLDMLLTYAYGRTMCQHCLQKHRTHRQPLLVFIVVGILSTIWLILRTGRRPDRIRYPCQQLAAANSLMFLGWLGGIFSGHYLYRKFKGQPVVKIGLPIVLIFLFILGYKSFGIDIVKNFSFAQSYDHAPICPGGNCATWPKPRVVSIKNTDAVIPATVGNCPSPYTASSCYFTDQQVNQTVVENMLDQAVTTMTGRGSVSLAWTKLFSDKFGSDYQAGKKIGIKINFNNSASGYGNAGRYNPLPQTVVALLKQLRDKKGVPEENIYLYDCSRAFYAYFTDNIYQKGFTKIHYVGTRIDSSYPVVKEPPRQGSLVKLTPHHDMYICAQVEDTFDYIINLPLLRPHGGAGVTLGFKNHLGSFYTGTGGYSIETLHTPIYNPGSAIDISHPLVQLNGLTANGFSEIRDKTVLTLVDGLYSNNNNNTDPPNVIYETLILGQDPVAVDSVMFDHLRTFSQRPTVVSQNYLHAAAQAGLGVHEHWNTSTKKYSQIDYVSCLENCVGVSPQPSSSSWPSSSVTSPASPFSPGDVNHDGLINHDDLVLVILNFSRQPTQVPNYFDPMVDAKINIFDSAYVIGDW